MENKIISKQQLNQNNQNYVELAIWCNNNNHMIVDKGDYYEAVEIPPPPLYEIKETKKEELKAIRNQLEIEPLQVGELIFDVDKDSLMRINACQQVLHGAMVQNWTMADNTVRPITAEIIKELYKALAYRSNLLHEKYNKLKEKLMNCKTEEEVGAIEWE